MIKLIKDEEYIQLINVWDSAVRHTHDFLAEEDFQFYKSQLPLYFQCVTLYGFYNEDNLILGFLGVSKNKVEMLFVHQAAHRKGVGKALLYFATRNLGIKELDVNEQNCGAVDFYQAQGFEAIGRMEIDGSGKPYPLLCLRLK